MQDLVYFSDNGLTTTSANHLANKAKEYVAQLENELKNISFVNADAGDFIVEYAKNNKADVVIMDPPRSGSTPEFLDSLLTIRPDRIVYISCGPDTQARDIKRLVKGGYRVKTCQPFDMFPHTGHVETVVLMSSVK